MVYGMPVAIVTTRVVVLNGLTDETVDSAEV